MRKLHIQLLQSLGVLLDDQPLHLRDDKTRGLLAWLVVHHDQPQRRERLIALLWPGKSAKAGRANLRKVLFHLRRLLKEAREGLDALLLTTTTQTVVLHSGVEGVSADFLELQDLLTIVRERGIDAVETANRCENLINTGATGFLDGVSLLDCDEFNWWLERQRDTVQRGVLELLHALAEYAIDRIEPTRALTFCRQMERIDPIYEPAQRLLLRLLAENGRSSEALAGYGKFQRRLQVRYGLEPEAETKSLAQRIRRQSLPAASEPIHNLPALSSILIGREQELRDISRLLQSARCRLLTLVGMGGIGKTHLAIAAAHRQLDRDWETVYFVGLEADAVCNTEDDLAIEIVNALHATVPMRGLQPASDRLQRMIGQRKMLLIVDNLEQAIEGATLLARLSKACPALTLLVTSRIPLSLHNEFLYDVRPLAVPVVEEAFALESNAAAQLFLERARQLQFGFEPSREEQLAIGTVCRLTGGHPLAIELAAGHIRSHSVQAISAMLRDSAEMLHSDARDLPVRQQSIGAVIENTWQLLNADEQSVFMFLTVFVGGYSAEAAQIVAHTTMPTLTRLLQLSLIQKEIAGHRFRIHPLLQRYGNNQLQRQPDIQRQVRDDHATWFLNYITKRRSGLDSAEMSAVIHELETETDNIVAAWNHSVRQEQWFLPVAACEGVSLFMERTLRYQQGITLFTNTLSAPSLPPLLQCELRTRTARLQMLGRQLSPALESAKQALEQAIALHHNELIARNRLCIASVYSLSSANEEAEHEIELALALCDNFPFLASLANEYLADIAYRKAEYRSSYERRQVALAFYEQHAPRFPKQRSVVHNNLGTVAYRLGRFEEARQHFEAAAQLRQRLDQAPAGGLVSLANLGLVALAQQRFDDALQFFTQSLEAAQRSNNRFAESRALGQLAEYHRQLGETQHALQLAMRALSVARQLNLSSLLANQLALLALLHIRQGDLDVALEFILNSLQEAASRNEPETRAYVLTVAGEVLLANGDLEAARAAFREALSLREWMGQEMLSAELRADNARVMHYIDQG